jgi:hypothetical protein
MGYKPPSLNIVPSQTSQSQAAAQQYERLLRKLNIGETRGQLLYMIAKTVGIDPLVYAMTVKAAGIATAKPNVLTRTAVSERNRALANNYRPKILDALRQAGVKDVATVVTPPKSSKQQQGDQPYRLADGKKLIVNGKVISKSDFIKAKQDLGDIFHLYTGTRASDKQVAQYLQNPQSQQQLIHNLANSPGFFKSPIYQKQAAVYATTWQGIYGNTKGLSRNLVKKAIVNSWNITEFGDNARQLPQYKNSIEFKDNLAKMNTIYQNIYGNFGHNASQIVNRAATNRWTPDQFAAWLRNRPEYVNSAEQHAVADNLANTFGTVITSGAVPKKNQPEPVGGVGIYHGN